MRVGLPGSGLMGGNLGTLFARAGHEVVFSYQSVGIEIDAQCFALAKKAVPQLAALYPTFQGETTELEADYAPASPNSDQLALALADKTPPVLHSTKSRAGRAVQPLSYKKPAAAA